MSYLNAKQKLKLKTQISCTLADVLHFLEYDGPAEIEFEDNPYMIEMWGTVHFGEKKCVGSTPRFGGKDKSSVDLKRQLTIRFSQIVHRLGLC